MSTLSRRHLVAPTLALALAASLSACSTASEPAAATSTVTMTAASAPATTSSDQTQTDTTVTTAGNPDAASAPTTAHRHTVATSTAGVRTSSGGTADTATPTAVDETEDAPDKGSDRVITLGPVGSHPGGRGFGNSRPPRIDLGGDPTGDISGITWDGWGLDTAEGTGTSYYVPKGKSTSQAVRATARVRAWDPGTCKGETVYRKVAWWFPAYGEKGPRAEDGPIDTCS